MSDWSCNPIDGSPPGSSVPGILQARTLKWAAISFSNAWKWKVKVKSLSRVRLFPTPWTAAYQAPPSMWFSRQEYCSGVPSPSRHFKYTYPLFLLTITAVCVFWVLVLHPLTFQTVSTLSDSSFSNIWPLGSYNLNILNNNFLVFIGERRTFYNRNIHFFPGLIMFFLQYFIGLNKGFPGGSGNKESAWNAGDPGSILGSGKSLGEGKDNPLQYSCLENSVDRGAWQPSVHGVAELDTTEWLTLLLLYRS